MMKRRTGQALVNIKAVQEFYIPIGYRRRRRLIKKQLAEQK